MTTAELAPRELRTRVVRLMRQLVSYAVFGGLGALTDFVLFTLLVAGLSAGSLPANIVSVLAGMSVSFMLNSHFTFRATDRKRLRLARFLTVGSTGLVLSTLLLGALVHSLGLEPLLAKPLTIAPVVGFQFLANRYWSFGRVGT